MESDKIFKGVLKELVLEYQEKLDPQLFERILSRVDNLVLSVVHGCRKVCPHLMDEDAEDIYQTALIGLNNGLLKVKLEESSDLMIARMIAYMKCAIRVEFPYKPMPEEFILSQKSVEVDNSAFLELENEFIQESLEQLVKEEILTQKELNLVLLRYKREFSCEKISKLFDMPEGTVRKYIQDALLRIRHQFRVRGILEDQK